MGSLDEVFAPYPVTLTVEQCAQLLGQEPVTIYRWLQRGLIPGYKMGRSWVIYRDQLRENMESERAAREAAASDPPN